MNRKYWIGVLLLGCLAVLAIGRGQESPRSQALPTATPAILVGGCANAAGIAGQSSILFGMGQWYLGCVNGRPAGGTPMPSGGVLQNMRVAGAWAPKANVGGVAAVWVNGVSTALTCTVEESGTCSDSVHTVRVNAGDAVAATFTPAFNQTFSAVVSLEKSGSF